LGFRGAELSVRLGRMCRYGKAIAMKRNFQELTERERIRAREELMLPAGELLALFTAGLLTLGLVAGSLTLISAPKSPTRASVAGFSGAVVHKGMTASRIEAKAADARWRQRLGG
jgi:hypothetical protein